MKRRPPMAKKSTDIVVSGADAQEEMQRIRERLREFYSDVEIYIYLRSPHPQLDGKKVIDVVRKGRAADVHAIIDRLRDSVYL